MFSEDSFFGRHKFLSAIGLCLLLCVLVVVVVLGFRMRGPYRSYRLDFVKPESGAGVAPGALQVGVAMRDITPDLSQYDAWTDADNDNLYNPKKGDSFVDVNGNGKFDGVWLAGFGNNRPAKDVHDHIWTRAIAFRNNGVTVVMVTIDSIGIFQEEFIKVRKSLDPSLGIDHVMFSSLHIHEVPDTMGLWSYPWAFLSKDKGYMELVSRANKEAVEEAVRSLQPAEMFCAEMELEPEGFMDDSRLPEVFNKRLCCARFAKPGAGETIATLVCWSNHPETLGSRNPSLTADFCYYLRRGMESGVGPPNGVDGFGGMCLYFQGTVGGLMTQLHTTVPHRNGVETFKEATFDKAQALGENVAIECANLLRGDKVWENKNSKVAVAAKTIYAPMSGLMGFAMTLGFVHPGWYWGTARTEVNVIRIGDVEVLTCPGELYPEIAVGGVEAPAGRDFPIDPIETPGLYSLMKGKMNLIIGLANDEVGYMLPKSQWDMKPPYAYDRDKPQYGEENSGGPEVGPAYYREAVALLERMHAHAAN